MVRAERGGEFTDVVELWSVETDEVQKEADMAAGEIHSLHTGASLFVAS